MNSAEYYKIFYGHVRALQQMHFMTTYLTTNWKEVPQISIKDDGTAIYDEIRHLLNEDQQKIVEIVVWKNITYIPRRYMFPLTDNKCEFNYKNKNADKKPKDIEDYRLDFEAGIYK